MATNRASITTRSSWLGTEFGEQFARRQFGDAVVDALPRYVRGKNKGKPKAEIEWAKVERGGWVSTYCGTGQDDHAGYVEARVGDIIAARLIQREWGTGHVAEEFARKEAKPGDARHFRGE